MVGQSLSQYKITAELGRGGMGIVYRATDTKLNRDVAIKVLPAAALASEDDRARFFREAQAAAQLHHPNIATVFQIDEAIALDENGTEVNASDGPRPFIAMELVGGQTLHEYISTGPMKLTEAVQVGIQVAEALKAAHAKDIVHRDIKSANVMLTDDGIAKVLDFGLAKTNQSTMLTKMGSTLGTVNYMSPEQARGQEVDGRTDLYSLGTMLYEMIAGRLPFGGEYEQAVVYSILNESASPLTSIRTGVPMQLEWIVNKLLAKDANGRYQGAGELIVDLKAVDVSASGYSSASMISTTSGTASAMASPGMPSAPAATPIPSVNRSFSVVHGILGAAILVAGLIVGWIASDSGSNDQTVPSISHRLSLDAMEVDLAFVPRISPTGKYLTHGMVSFNPFKLQIALYDLETSERRVVPRSDSLVFSVFSESDEWLMMSGPLGIVRSNADGSLNQLLKEPPPESSSNFGAVAVWDDADHILYSFSNRGAINRMRMDGSGEEILFEDSTLFYIMPVHSLTKPGHVLVNYAVEEGDDLVGIVDTDIGSLSRLPGIGWPTIVRDRFLISHSPDSTLLVTELDGNYETVGASIPVLNNVVSDLVTVAPDGSLFYFDMSSDLDARTELVWYPLDGGMPISMQAPGGHYYEPTVSQEGGSVAYIKANGGDDDVGDLVRREVESGVETQLTFSMQAGFPDWHGPWIYFHASVGDGPLAVYRVSADGGRPELILGLPEGVEEPNVGPDGLGFVYTRNDTTQTSGGHIWYYDLETGDQVQLTDETGMQNSGVISPDGRFVAYEANGGGNAFSTWVSEIDGDGRWKISGEGFGNPDWAPDGQTLYFDQNGIVYKRSVSTDGAFRILSETVEVHNFGTEQDYAVSPDGARLYATAMSVSAGDQTSDFTVVTNWVDQIIRMLDERGQQGK